MVQARARGAHPDRARPRPHPPLRHRRRGGAVFRLHPGLGAHVFAGIAQHRGRRRPRPRLRRRHMLFVGGARQTGSPMAFILKCNPPKLVADSTFSTMASVILRDSRPEPSDRVFVWSNQKYGGPGLASYAAIV